MRDTRRSGVRDTIRGTRGRYMEIREKCTAIWDERYREIHGKYKDVRERHGEIRGRWRKT
jgi:hypothetical protein